jgi:hypothetical protein
LFKKKLLQIFFVFFHRLWYPLIQKLFFHVADRRFNIFRAFLVRRNLVCWQRACLAARALHVSFSASSRLSFRWNWWQQPGHKVQLCPINSRWYLACWDLAYRAGTSWISGSGSDGNLCGASAFLSLSNGRLYHNYPNNGYYIVIELLAKILTYYMQALYLLRSCGRVGVRIHRLDMCCEPAWFFPTISTWYIDVDTYVHVSVRQTQLPCDMLNWPRIIRKGFLERTVRIHCRNTHTLLFRLLEAATRERRNLKTSFVRTRRRLAPKTELPLSNGIIIICLSAQRQSRNRIELISTISER